MPTTDVAADVPTVPPYRPDDPALVAEHAAFHRMLPDLLGTCLGQYVAVSGGQVVASGPDPAAAEAGARAAVGDAPTYIGVVHTPALPGAVRIGGVQVVPAGDGG